MIMFINDEGRSLRQLSFGFFKHCQGFHVFVLSNQILLVLQHPSQLIESRFESKKAMEQMVNDIAKNAKTKNVIGPLTFSDTRESSLNSLESLPVASLCQLRRDFLFETSRSAFALSQPPSRN